MFCETMADSVASSGPASPATAQSAGEAAQGSASAHGRSGAAESTAQLGPQDILSAFVAPAGTITELVKLLKRPGQPAEFRSGLTSVADPAVGDRLQFSRDVFNFNIDNDPFHPLYQLDAMRRARQQGGPGAGSGYSRGQLQGEMVITVVDLHPVRGLQQQGAVALSVTFIDSRQQQQQAQGVGRGWGHGAWVNAIAVDDQNNAAAAAGGAVAAMPVPPVHIRRLARVVGGGRDGAAVVPGGNNDGSGGHGGTDRMTLHLIDKALCGKYFVYA